MSTDILIITTLFTLLILGGAIYPYIKKDKKKEIFAVYEKENGKFNLDKKDLSNGDIVAHLLTISLTIMRDSEIDKDSIHKVIDEIYDKLERTDVQD